MKNFIKKHFLLKNLLWLLAIFSIVSIILPFFIEKALLEKFTFIITALAFIAGAMAIILQKMAMKQQEKDGKKTEELLKEQIEKPRYEHKIIDDLKNLMTNTKDTIQHTLIKDRLEAFYTMNKNIKL